MKKPSSIELKRQLKAQQEQIAGKVKPVIKKVIGTLESVIGRKKSR